MNGQNHRLIVLLVLFLVLLSGTDISVFAENEADSVVTITPLANVEVSEENMLLDHLVMMKGGDEALLKKISAVFIGKSPQPGKSRIIDTDFIGLRMRQSDIDMSRVKIEPMQEIEILRGFVTVSPEEIEQIVSQELPGVIAMDERRISIREIKAASGIILPKGGYTYSVVPPKDAGLSGKLLLSVFFEASGDFKKRVYVTAEIDRYIDVVVAAKPLSRNQIIKEADLEIKTMTVAEAPANGIVDPEDLVGNKVRRNLNKGEVLRSELIDVTPLINRNDVVQMIVETSNFKIVTLGEAKEKGFKGDRIKVLNLDSKNEVYALILDSNSVKVEF